MKSEPKIFENNPYQEYEIRKKMIPEDLTPEEYETAIWGITEDLKI